MNIKKLLQANHTRRLFFSTVDQIILSGVNFALSYILLKILTKESYGLYNLIIPISLLFTALQNALINTPLMVEYWNLENSRRDLFVSSLTLLQKKIFLILILIIIIISFILFLITKETSEPVLILSFGILLIGILSREFLRNYFFTKELPEKAVRNDLKYLIYMTFFIVVFYYTGLIYVSTILIIIGLASLFSSFKFNNKLIIHNDFILAKQHFHESFRHGKWALLGVIVTHIQTYGYIYIIGIFFATKDVGDLSAIRLLFIPFSFISAGYSKIAIPRGSKLISEKRNSRFFKEEIYFSVIYSLLILVYTIIINLLPKEYLILILKREYMSAIDYLPYYSIITTLSIWGSTGSNGLQSLRRFKTLSEINTISMLIVLTFTAVLINFNGIKGALIATILGQLSNISGMWYHFYKLSKV
ncbi:Hypothetical protein IALB_2468 [Ignavibacterium album JCM 16511]|uniref:Uncharacterized protein n=1 Tax=Ignavibacterium album (strain DSM 19864 / JCM 16511 / NBRC 101810 / Mat9-16) TaxID=945713 RepID=I0AMG4_IGNAJ|nr:polysaccharide biosynthesis C-terminal domain-containing protein [Ignavibacterium album]AFH50171.1 Hypothetical protein IALB_2468 [Ignavibacterium album JCM 16511]